jgi:hypothetical protein
MKPDKHFVEEQARRMRELLQMRAALPEDDMSYLVEKVERMKDERLKACIATLIGWGDDERAEVETFVAIAIEVMKRTNIGKLRECARIVEMKYYMKELRDERKDSVGDA